MPIKADTAMGANKAPSPAGEVGGAAVVKHIYFQPPANETATKSAMRIHVVGAEGGHIAAAKISAMCLTKEKAFNHIQNTYATTTAASMSSCRKNSTTFACLPWSGRLRAVVGPLESERPAAPTILPDEFTFSMKKGTVIGGFVKNDDDQPISGAKVLVRAMDFSDSDEGIPFDVPLGRLRCRYNGFSRPLVAKQRPASRSRCPNRAHPSRIHQRLLLG